MVSGTASGSIELTHRDGSDREFARFTQPDPIGIAGGLNVYGYAGGDPVNFADPFGLSPCCVQLGWMPGAAGAAARRADDDALEAMLSVAGTLAPGSSVVARAIPAVQNKGLGNIVKDLYKGALSRSPIGTGSTADAIRNEAKTGLPTGGKFHFQKSEQYSKALEKWIESNPTAGDRDLLVARSLLNDLRDALVQPRSKP